MGNPVLETSTLKSVGNKLASFWFGHPAPGLATPDPTCQSKTGHNYNLAITQRSWPGRARGGEEWEGGLFRGRRGGKLTKRGKGYSFNDSFGQWWKSLFEIMFSVFMAAAAATISRQQRRGNNKPAAASKKLAIVATRSLQTSKLMWQTTNYCIFLWVNGCL